MKYHMQAWRYGPPQPSVMGLAGAFSDPEGAIEYLQRLFNLDRTAFEEPFLPLPMDLLSATAYEGQSNMVMVHDEQGIILAYAPLPVEVPWPPSAYETLESSLL